MAPIKVVDFRPKFEVFLREETDVVFLRLEGMITNGLMNKRMELHDWDT